MPGWALSRGVILNVMKSCVCAHVCTRALGEGCCVCVCWVYVVWVSGVWCVCVHAQARVLESMCDMSRPILGDPW